MSDWAEYDDFLNEANKDDRVGDHDAIVLEYRKEQWPDGQPRNKVIFALITAGQAKCDLTLGDVPPASVLKEQMGTMERSKKRAIANTISMRKQLAEFYGLNGAEFEAGQTFRVKTAKNRQGFIRVIAFLPKDQIGKSAIQQATSDVPF